MSPFRHPALFPVASTASIRPECGKQSQLSLKPSQQGQILRKFHGRDRLFSLSNMGNFEKFIQSYTGSSAAPQIFLGGCHFSGKRHASRVRPSGRPSFTRSTTTLHTCSVHASLGLPVVGTCYEIVACCCREARFSPNSVKTALPQVVTPQGSLLRTPLLKQSKLA